MPEWNPTTYCPATTLVQELTGMKLYSPTVIAAAVVIPVTGLPETPRTICPRFRVFPDGGDVTVIVVPAIDAVTGPYVWPAVEEEILNCCDPIALLGPGRA